MPNSDESQGESREVNLDTHPLVDKLHPNPDEIPNIVTLTGYLGPSRKDGCVRLYSDLTFRNYYEIPTAGILATAQTDAGDENSPTSVHVSADTVLEAVSISSQSMEARYLQGSIASGHLGSAAPAGAPAAFTITITQYNCGTAQTVGCNAAGMQAANVAADSTLCTWSCYATCLPGAGCTAGVGCAAGAQAAGTIPSLLTQINCGPARTIGCCVGAGAQAADVGMAGDTAYPCTFVYPCTMIGCNVGGAGAQAAQPAARVPPPTQTDYCTVYSVCCNYPAAGAQAAHPAAQAAGTFPTVTRINCGPAQTVMCGP